MSTRSIVLMTCLVYMTAALSGYVIWYAADEKPFYGYDHFDAVVVLGGSMFALMIWSAIATFGVVKARRKAILYKLFALYVCLICLSLDLLFLWIMNGYLSDLATGARMAVQ